MQPITDYKVIHASSPSELADKVNDYILQGFQPYYSPMCMAKVPFELECVFIQVVVKYGGP
jgi:hypothetical protein